MRGTLILALGTRFRETKGMNLSFRAWRADSKPWCGNPHVSISFG